MSKLDISFLIVVCQFLKNNCSVRESDSLSIQLNVQYGELDKWQSEGLN